MSAEEITSVKKHIEELKDELRIEENRLHLLQMEQHGISIGMLVAAKGKTYRVTGARYFGHGQPWLFGALQRKDGTFGATRNIYDQWERV